MAEACFKGFRITFKSLGSGITYFFLIFLLLLLLIKDALNWSITTFNNVIKYFTFQSIVVLNFIHQIVLKKISTKNIEQLNFKLMLFDNIVFTVFLLRLMHKRLSGTLQNLHADRFV